MIVKMINVVLRIFYPLRKRRKVRTILCEVLLTYTTYTMLKGLGRALRYVPWFAGGYVVSRGAKAGYTYSTDDTVRLQVDRAARLWMVAVSPFRVVCMHPCT